MLGMKNRDALKDGTVVDEFEWFSAQVRGFFLKEHNEDGTHIVVPPIDNLVPSGAILMWTIPTPPTGWYICDGSTRERLADKRLFDIIGTTYGPGDGSLTFNLPDMRGKFPLGVAAAGTGSTLAGTGGAIDHTHAGGTTGASSPGTDSQGSHNHTATTSSDGSHAHTLTPPTALTGTPSLSEQVDNNLDGSTVTVARNTHIHGVEGSTDSAGTHNHTLTTSTDGSHSHTVNSHTHTGGTSGTGNPPFLALHFIIKS